MSEAAQKEARPVAPAEPPAVQPAPELPDPWPVPSSQEIKRETTPFSDPDWRVRVYSWSGFGLRLLIILATVITALQYFTVREEKRVERAFELVTLWEQPKYQDAQRALDERLAPLVQSAGAVLGADASPAERQVAARQVGEAAMREGGGAMPLAEFERHFGDIVYFLNRVAFCVEEGLCSRAVTDAYFRDFAVSFWSYFSGYAAKRRAVSANYARPLEDYATGKAESGWLSFWPFAASARGEAPAGPRAGTPG